MTSTKHKTALPGYYTATEASERLGYRDSSYLSRLCSQGKIVAYKVGTIWLIPESWVISRLGEEPKGQGSRGVERK